MRFDDVFKRCFVVVICFLLGAAAYFQASGMMRLTGAALELDPQFVGSALEATKAKLSPRVEAQAASFGHATSADTILERNPFDSVTGSLIGPKRGPEAESPEGPVFGADPYADPPCEGARVLLITESDDPEWSFAAVAGDGQKPMLRRQGDEVAGRVMLAMARDRIWLGSNRVRCQARLGAPLTAGGSGKGQNPPPERGGGTPGGGAVNRGVLPPDISARIRRISANELEVERSVISDIMEKQGELLGRVRIVPEKDGNRTGLRLFGIKPESLLGVLGMENGDRLLKINGMEIADPTSALEAYARLTSASHLVVSVERRGKPTNIDISIK